MNMFSERAILVWEFSAGQWKDFYVQRPFKHAEMIVNTWTGHNRLEFVCGGSINFVV